MSVYDGARYLRLAIDSILSQTFADFEFIIVDDGSTDSTPTILDTYTDSHIVRILNPTNIGLIQSLNRGLALARGEFIARQDADDISHPERLQKQVLFLDENPQIGLLGTSIEYIDEKNNSVRVSIRSAEPTLIRWQLLFGDPIIHSSVMFRRELVDNLGGYDERARHVEDYELWCRFSRHTEITQLPDVLLRFRKHPASISSLYLDEQEEMTVQIMQRSMEHLLGRPVALEQARWVRQAGRGVLLAPGQCDVASALIRDLVHAFHQRWQPGSYASRCTRGDAVRRIQAMASRHCRAYPREALKAHFRAASLGLYGFRLRSLCASILDTVFGQGATAALKRLVGQEVG